MIRLSKLSDYGLVLMACIAENRGQRHLRTARELAIESNLPLPTVSRLLKVLLRGRLLVSRRGKAGGYALARDPLKISVVDVVAAIEGPIALTDCSTNGSGLCSIEACCRIKGNQRLISNLVERVLGNIKLSDLNQSLEIKTVAGPQDRMVPTVQIAPGRIQ